MSSPVQGQVFRYQALRRQINGNTAWLLCTGTSMGRWTSWFGPWNLAGDGDSVDFVKVNHGADPKTEIVEFEIHCNSPLLPQVDTNNSWLCHCGEVNTLNPSFNPDSKCTQCGALK